MNKEQIQAILRLFKAYLVENEIAGGAFGNTVSSVESGILYSSDVPISVKIEAEKMYGLKPEEWNNTFHKSFSTVMDTPIEKLIAQQIIHYFTTYGLEAVGLFDSNLVYIPHEKLEIPDIEEDIKLILISKIDSDELTNKLMTLATSGIALSKQTISDIMELSDYLDKTKLDEITNRELKIALYDKYNIVPKNNMEFLKYLVYKVTNSTLYIQNNEMIHNIKHADRNVIYTYLKLYIDDVGYEKLAEIFLRNKNMFLAFKTKEPRTRQEKSLNKIVNRISKLAIKYHKPLKTNILDRLNSIKTLTKLETRRQEILNELDKVTAFREIRILNGLKYRYALATSSSNDKSIVYRVRNGKVYATELELTNNVRAVRILDEIIRLIENHLVTKLTPVLKDKTFCIDNGVEFTAPTSEKQFVGDIPEGSTISISRTSNMVIGVHWTNLPKSRVDLDLKMMNRDSEYGWNAMYLSNDKDIVFSGDVTDAPEPLGATEVFLITPSVKSKSFLIKLNNFTQNKATVPFEFFVAEHDTNNISSDFVVNPNKVRMLLHNKFDNEIDTTNTLTLGYVEIDSDTITIYFKNFSDIKGRVSSRDTINKHIYNYTNMYSNVQLTLNDLIIKCGGIITNQPAIEELQEVIIDNETLYKKVSKPVDYNLSLQSITKDSIITIFEGVK